MVIFVNRNEGTIEKQVESSEKNAINKLAHFVDGKSLPDRACIPDGFIAFVKESAITRFDFSFSDTCKTFSIQKEGKTIYSRMSGEAYDFLQSLKSGNNFY